MDLSDGTWVAPPAEPVELNTHEFLLDKTEVKDEQSTQADGGADTCIINEQGCDWSRVTQIAKSKELR